MAAPGFGFSMNDVVLLVQVTNKVVHALKKEGATSEYQKGDQRSRVLTSCTGNTGRILQQFDRVPESPKCGSMSARRCNQVDSALQQKAAEQIRRLLGFTLDSSAPPQSDEECRLDFQGCKRPCKVSCGVGATA